MEEKKVKKLFTEIEQLAFVVSDLMEAVHLFADRYGIGPWTFMDFGSACGLKEGEYVTVENAVHEGKPMSQYGVKGAMCWVDNIEIELLQPIDDESTFAKFLHERGPGLHHISLKHPNSYEETLSIMTQAGHPAAQTATIDTTETCTFCDHADILGTFFEIHKRPIPFIYPDVPKRSYPPQPDDNG